jgi:glycosyltransferase involved in cell wall biosynthesis
MDIVIIAHFITEFAKEGTSRFVYIAEKLSKSHDVELITSQFDHITKKQRVSQAYDLDTKVTLLEEPSYPKNVCLQRFVSHRYFGQQVKKYLESRKKPDVIYCAVPSLDCAYYAAQYAQRNNIRFIIDVQDLWPEAFKMIFNVPLISDMIFYPMKRQAEYIYSCADKIVGVSKTYCERAKKVNKKSAECIPVFLGTKLDLFDKYVQENRVERNDDNFILGYCGTLGHSYDIKCVLDAMIHLRNNGHDNISLWVMGDGPLKNDFEKYAIENRLDVVFYGRVPYSKMCGLLASCDVCVNPISKRAAQSIINKHGDYAASGLPVISTQETLEYRNLISDNKCGINCECGDYQNVADAILFLKNNEEERLAMGENARKIAEELFNRDSNYQRIMKLFV